MVGNAVVVMGVASCGKSTVGYAIAKKLKERFVESDELHPPSNVAKMSAGVPLTDDDRWPWLRLVGNALRGSTGVVASCSALKQSYRKCIVEEAQRRVLFVHLDGEKSILERRIGERRSHFMPPCLLASQLQILELPGADEGAIAIDAALPITEVVDRAVAWMRFNHIDRAY